MAAAYKGVDLTHPLWLLAEPRSKGDLVPSTGSSPGKWPTTPIFKADRDFWTRALDALTIPEPPAEPFPSTPIGETIKELVAGGGGRFAEAVFNNQDFPNLWVALAVPYRTPRLILKDLHHLFGSRILNLGIKKEKLSVVEAPVALATEFAAQEQEQGWLDEPTPLVLLTGEPPMRELTAATVRRAEKALRIEVTAHAVIDPADPSGSLSRFAEALPADRASRLVHPGMTEAAGQVAALLGDRVGPELDLQAHAVAVGAVRYGLLLEKQPSLNKPISQVEVKRIAPWAIGVLGTNRSGDFWCWRRLIERGAAISAEPALLPILARRSTIEPLVLAECDRPDHAERLWIARKDTLSPPDEARRRDWASAGLRWHDVDARVEIPSSPAFQWRHSFLDRSRWNPRCECVSWKVVAADSDADP